GPAREMRVIERFTQGKTGNEARNEDALVTTPHFIAVIDGATPKACPPLEGLSAGRFAALTLARAVETLPPDSDARSAIATLTQALRRATERYMPVDAAT